MINTPTKVIAFECHGNNLIFSSLNDACEYYNGISDKQIHVEQMRRIINGDGLWQYIENGKTREVFFDILEE